MQLLKHKWSTLRINFSFMSCPSCKKEIQFRGLSDPIAKELRPLRSLKHKVETEALFNARRQRVLKDKRLTTKGDEYYKKPKEFAMHKCTFYECFKCKTPYFGGLIDCQQEMQMNEGDEDANKPENLLCQDCLHKEVGAGQASCEKHGTQHIVWKCMFCCS